MLGPSLTVFNPPKQFMASTVSTEISYPVWSFSLSTLPESEVSILSLHIGPSHQPL